MLVEMFELQQKLQEVADPRAKDLMNDEYIKDMILAAYSELSEILNEINWKPWRQTKKTVYSGRYKNEIIDLFHFVINLSIAVDMEPKEFFNRFVDKNKENHERQKRGY